MVVKAAVRTVIGLSIYAVKEVLEETGLEFVSIQPLLE
jgi:hypothetical protein